MALVYQATLTPSKLELLAAWLPTRSWFRGSSPLDRIGSYRFDDPAGEVGIEIILVTTDDRIYQVPLTYRGAPLPGANDHLVGTMKHSVLGDRWIYDGCADPVAINALATAILTGGSDAPVEIEQDGRLVTLPQGVSVRGSGTPSTVVPPVTTATLHDEPQTTRITTTAYHLDLAREIGAPITGTHHLTGTWPTHPPTPLAALTLT